MNNYNQVFTDTLHTNNILSDNNIINLGNKSNDKTTLETNNNEDTLNIDNVNSNILILNNNILTDTTANSSTTEQDNNKIIATKYYVDNIPAPDLSTCVKNNIDQTL